MAIVDIEQFRKRLGSSLSNKDKPLIVKKYGGSSVGSAKAIERTASIVEEYSEEYRLVLVISAVKGVTDSLVRTCNLIEEKNQSGVELALEDILGKHEAIIDELSLGARMRSSLENRLNFLMAKLWDECLPIKKITPERRDSILRFGESLSAPIVASAISNRGLFAEPVDTTEIIETDHKFGNASPEMEKTALYSRRRLLPMIDNGVIPVLTGFIGATKDYKPTTLGRGGSDYTASIIGAVLEAEEVWIWTDVDGVYDKDPNVYSNAQIIPKLNKIEAQRMAERGAKVLYEKTLLPLMDSPAKLRVKNTFNPDYPGTLIG